MQQEFWDERHFYVDTSFFFFFFTFGEEVQSVSDVLLHRLLDDDFGFGGEDGPATL